MKKNPLRHAADSRPAEPAEPADLPPAPPGVGGHRLQSRLGYGHSERSSPVVPVRPPPRAAPVRPAPGPMPPPPDGNIWASLPAPPRPTLPIFAPRAIEVPPGVQASAPEAPISREVSPGARSPPPDALRSSDPRRNLARPATREPAPSLPTSGLSGQSCPWLPQHALARTPVQPERTIPGGACREGSATTEGTADAEGRAWREPPSPLPEPLRCPRCRGWLPTDGEEHRCCADAELEEVLRAVTRDRRSIDAELLIGLDELAGPGAIEAGDLLVRARRWL